VANSLRESPRKKKKSDPPTQGYAVYHRENKVPRITKRTKVSTGYKGHRLYHFLKKGREEAERLLRRKIPLGQKL